MGSKAISLGRLCRTRLGTQIKASHASHCAEEVLKPGQANACVATATTTTLVENTVTTSLYTTAFQTITETSNILLTYTTSSPPETLTFTINETQIETTTLPVSTFITSEFITTTYLSSEILALSAKTTERNITQTLDQSTIFLTLSASTITITASPEVSYLTITQISTEPGKLEFPILCLLFSVL